MTRNIRQRHGDRRSTAETSWRLAATTHFAAPADASATIPTGFRLGTLGLVLAASLFAGLAPGADPSERGLGFSRLAGLRQVEEVRISPDGEHVAYVLRVPRVPGQDEDGPAWHELHVVSWDGTTEQSFVHGAVHVSDVRFTPDGRHLTYLAKRDDDDETSVWAVPVHGGESRRLFGFDEPVEQYRVSPDGKTLAFVAFEPETAEREHVRDAGYDEEVFEEDWRPRRAWIVDLAPIPPVVRDPATDPGPPEPRALPVDGSVFQIEWAPDGRHVAVSVAPTPLIDDEYMSRRIRVVRVADGEVTGAIDNPGKLGAFTFSPDGKHVALITAADPNDPKEGRLRVVPVGGGMFSDLLPDLDGHVSAIAWRDARTVAFVADVGVETVLGEVSMASERTTRLTSGATDDAGRIPVMAGLSLSGDGRRAAFAGAGPRHPAEVYVVAHGDSAPRRLTNSNPWLADVPLAPQEVVRWSARDGLQLDGVLIRPLDGDVPAPLLVMVHGGPESHDRNGWVTSYSRPGQLAAARGYAVLYPNYRGSTGRGVQFSKLGQGDAAGREFDDLVDAVDHLVDAEIADPERVGVNGGSYGGYATAWLATKYSSRFRAGVMFVGISNEISKGLTTEIPNEDKTVHTRFDPWTRWQYSLERSPLYWAEQSRTALLIAGGTDDTRVHPGQSLQLYRALKGIGKTPVRYVRYPGEKHGNRGAAARDDYTRRLIQWMDHFVVAQHVEPPPWEIDHEIENDEEEDEEDEEEKQQQEERRP